MKHSKIVPLATGPIRMFQKLFLHSNRAGFPKYYALQMFPLQTCFVKHTHPIPAGLPPYPLVAKIILKFILDF